MDDFKEEPAAQELGGNVEEEVTAPKKKKKKKKKKVQCGYPGSNMVAPHTVEVKTPEDGGVPRRVRKAEAILQRRTSRLVLILELSADPDQEANHHAVLRSAENFGIQHVWLIQPPGQPAEASVLPDDDGSLDHAEGKTKKDNFT